MEKIFLDIINMSLMASLLILVVLIVRALLRKAPKWIMCLLWGLVAIRLICPLSLESVFSLIPSAEPVPQDIAMMAEPQINSGIPAINQVVNPIITETFSPEPVASSNPLQIIIPALATIWLVGIIGLLIYALVSFWILHRKVRGSVSVKDNIRQCDYIDTPFIFGVLRPIIYIPSGITEEQLLHVVAHENAHIKRLDHIWKPLGFLILAIHWFNPLVWLAYVLLCKDIEIACDEKVIENQGNEEAVSYSEALLACSVSRRNIMMCPLAFGEVSVKERIKHVLNYKKPGLWIIIAAVVVCIVVAVCFLTDPKSPDPKQTGAFHLDSQVDLEALRQNYPEYFELASFKGIEVYVWKLAEGDDSCGLMSGTNRKKDMSDMLGLKPISVDEAKAILNELGVGKEDVIVCPIYQLYSSYMYEIDDAYIEHISQLFEGCYVTSQDKMIGPAIPTEIDGTERVLSPNEPDPTAHYSLKVGAENVYALEYSLLDGEPYGIAQSDTPFEKGQMLSLEGLEGRHDLRGLVITAYDENKDIVWTASVPDSEDNRGLSLVGEGDWKVGDERSMR